MKTIKMFWYRAFVLIVAALIALSSCKKDGDDKNLVKDIDGNVYTTVKIGTQEWFAENLRTTRYNNGAPILNISDNATWAGLSTGAYTWYQNNETTYKDAFGALYNWHAVNTGNLCPTGWRVPTDAEWTTLINYAGGESVAGGKLKDVGTTRWASPNTAATDDYGFSALPGGIRYYDGIFYYAAATGAWWSSTESGTTMAWGRFMVYDFENSYRASAQKVNGYSIRCLRDN